MTVVLFVVLALAVTTSLGEDQDHYFLSDKFIADINNNATTWTAGMNFAADTPIEYLNSLSCDVEGNSSLPIKNHDLSSHSLPLAFDAGEKWQRCGSLREIREQGNCGDCWAMSAAATITDRECIHKRKPFHASTLDIVSCCQTCYRKNGCINGSSAKAFTYYQEQGVVSGGSFGTNSGCKPYTKAQHDESHVPSCARRCVPGSHIQYQKDLHHASKVYIVSGEEQIKFEILSNGPVVVSFDAYEDFYSYKGGVYEHTIGAQRGAHAMKVIGWGIKNNKPYWLCANSWGTDWGERGYVKFLRGSNHCGIERAGKAAIPLMSKNITLIKK